MSHLANVSKMGFYAFREEWLPAVASLFPKAASGRILDPCAGEGVALEHLSQTWGMTPYANEYDEERAALCAQRFGPVQAVHGDISRLRTSHRAFSAVWLNPPYDENRSDGAEDKRKEYEFLKMAWRWVQRGGYIFWVVYRQHLIESVAKAIARRSSEVTVYSIPEPDLDRYDQIIVVMRDGGENPDAYDYLMAGEFTELVPQPQPAHSWPQMISLKNFVYMADAISPDTAVAIADNSGLMTSKDFASLWRKVE